MTSNETLFLLAIGVVMILLMGAAISFHSWKYSISYQVDAMDNRQDVEADYLYKLEQRANKLEKD